jgi:hypothetical protein
MKSLVRRIAALAVAAALLGGCGRVSTPTQGASPGDSEHSAAWEAEAGKHQTLRDEVAASAGTVLASGTLDRFEWTLYEFADVANAMDGEGANIYFTLGKDRNWLDRPDPGMVFDSVAGGPEDSNEALVVAVASEAVARLELVADGRTWAADSATPERQAAFARVFWVKAEVASGVFSGEIIAYDSAGNVLQRRAFTNDLDPSE